MPFIAERYVYDLGEHAILLPDGRVLFIGLAGTTKFLIPDEHGSYSNGTITDGPPSPYTTLYTSHVVTNQGRILLWPGEYGTLRTLLPPGTNRVMEFDPRDDSWSVYEFAQTTAPALCDNGYHASPHVRLLDDGRAFGAFARTNSNDSDMVENTTTIFGSVFETQQHTEECLVWGPDGYYWNVKQFSYRYNTPLVNTVNRYPVVSGVYPEGGVGTRIDYIQKLICYDLPSAPSTQLRPYVDYDWWRWKDIAETGKLTSAEGVAYETGSMIYSPKLDKYVYAAGNGGVYTVSRPGANGFLSVDANYVSASELSTINGAERSDNYLLRRLAEFPMDSFSGVNSPRTGPIGTIRSTDAGKNANDIAGQGEITIVMDPTTSQTFITNYMQAPDTPKKHFWVVHSNKQRYSSFTATGVQFIESGICKFTGVAISEQVDLFTYANNVITGTTSGTGQNGDLTTAYTTSDILVFDRPFWDAREGHILNLPNGDLIIMGGLSDSPYDYSGFNSLGGIFKWDGTSPVLDFLTDDGESVTKWGVYKNLPVPDFRITIVPLPDGTIMFCGENILKFYELTVTEATPRANSTPVIQDFPTMAPLGGTVHLTVLRPNGDNEHVQQNDDFSPAIKNPIATLTSTLDNKVYRCFVHGLTYRGHATNGTGDVFVDIPDNIPVGTYELKTHAGLVSSPPAEIFIVPSGDPVFIDTYN